MINAVILFSFRFFLNFFLKLRFILLFIFAGGRENLGKRSMLETNMFAKIILLFRNKNNILFFRCFFHVGVLIIALVATTYFIFLVLIQDLGSDKLEIGNFNE